MKLNLFLAISTLLINCMCIAQVVDFEEYNLNQDTFLNGADGSMGFEVGNIFLPNSYDDTWGSWSGWAISTMTDTVTPGFNNQYSSISGSGYAGSNTYATTFVSGESIITTDYGSSPGEIIGFYINNATYTYLSMKDGDDFAKKFGGENGTDPDYLYVSIKGNSSDSIIFYLADFRSANPEEDYIIKDWTYVSIEGLPQSNTISFQLYSSDNGAFGMNTPGYFCIDDINQIIGTAVAEETEAQFTLYPNPASDQVYLDFEFQVKELSLYDIHGRKHHSRKQLQGIVSLDLAQLETGIYIIDVVTKNGKRIQKRLIKT